jgi:transcriptional regulator with GAF, ATPase, and Fis domain
MLLEKLLDMIISLVQAEKGYILIFKGKDIVAAAARNIKKENIGNPLRELSDSIIAKVIESGKPIIISDALNDTIFGSSKSIINLKLSSVLSAPLKSGHDLIGLIYLGNNSVTHLFEHDSLEVLTIFAALTSLIVQNAFLLNQLDVESNNNKFNMKYGDIIGSSPKMKEIFDKIDRVAPTDISVLITGETGTGKELVAQEIHKNSDRSDKPFIIVNCAAIPENLMESEFFGHKKGSFTSAINDSKGKFLSANHGTIFLDEIGEMPLNLQAKLLRVLQEKIVTPVGDTVEHYIDVRIIAATNKNLNEEVMKGKFREDLLYRLNVIQIEVPPLSERDDDIEILSRFFLNKFSEKYQKKVVGFTPKALEVMKKYSWSGNVRELENKIKKAVVLSDKIHITPELLGISDKASEAVKPLSIAKQEFQKEYILDALQKNNGNKAKTAKELEIDVRTIFRYLEKTMP